MPRSAPPVIVSGAWPSVVSSVAPIARSGAATRSSGRRLSDSSPVSVARNGRPASGPASMRIVEPELPASSTLAGARQPSSPPRIVTRAPSRSTLTPSPRRQPSVEAQSAASEKLPMRVSPSAIAPRIAARCEMDLSPGSVNVPRTDRAGSIFTARFYVRERGRATRAVRTRRPPPRRAASRSRARASGSTRRPRACGRG